MDYYNGKEIQERLGNIEEMIKLLLLNNVLEGEGLEYIEVQIISEIAEHINALGMHNPHLKYIENKYYLFVEIDNNDSITRIRKKFEQLQSLSRGMGVVLVFDRLHLKRKEALEKDKISYYHRENELRLFIAP